MHEDHSSRPGSPPPLRIIIHALGSAGDVHPFVGVGRALVERGHEVFVATNPVFRDTVIDGGLGFRALGTEEQFRQTRDDPDLWHPLRAMRAVFMRASASTSARPNAATLKAAPRPSG